MGDTGIKKPVRIGLTGAGGTGKGTLGQALAREIGLTFLPSHIQDTGQAMGMENYKDTHGLAGALAFQYAIMFGQIYQERALQLAGVGYVAERTTIDYIPYFTQRGIMRKDYVDPYVDTAYKWAQKAYDMIIYCPLDFAPDNAPWKERDQADRERTDQTIYEFINRLPNVPVLVAHGAPVERMKLARAFIESLIKP